MAIQGPVSNSLQPLRHLGVASSSTYSPPCDGRLGVARKVRIGRVAAFPIRFPNEVDNLYCSHAHYVCFRRSRLGCTSLGLDCRYGYLGHGLLAWRTEVIRDIGNGWSRSITAFETRNSVNVLASVSFSKLPATQPDPLPPPNLRHHEWQLSGEAAVGEFAGNFSLPVLASCVAYCR